jgi:hypothetical protein
MSQPIEPLPEGAVLLHVGFHKTGTTALQSAFGSTRAQLSEAGVLYPGELRSHHRAAMAVTERTWGWGEKGGRRHRPRYWEDLVAATAAHPGRVVISSEALSLARDDAVDRMVEELGADRLHVVGTLRPFARLLSSSWQQYLKYGLGMPYVEWLENVFADPPACPPSPNFWRRNDYVGVFGRWVERLGPDRVSLVILDERDRGYLFRTFETMVGLPEGLLVPDPEVGASNRSMSAAEAEMLRLVNDREARDWDWPLYQAGVRRGAIMRMVEARRPGPDEPGIATPEWAVAAAQQYGRDSAAGITALGMRVLGDLDSLAAPIPSGEPPAGIPALPADAAAEAVLGGIHGALRAPARKEEVASEVAEIEARAARRAVRSMSTKDAANLLGTRVREAGARRLPRVRRPAADKGDPGGTPTS